jgi:hypothetical protein
MRASVPLRARADVLFGYSGSSFLVTSLGGAVTGRGLEGFYVENTRLLSCDEITIDGKTLTPAAASPVDGHAFLAYAEVPPLDGMPPGTVYLEVARFLGEGMRTVLRFESYGREPACFELGLHVAADFADVDEVNQSQRQQTGPVEMTWDEARWELKFRYGHPDLDRAVAIRVEATPAPVRWEDGHLAIAMHLLPHQPTELRLAVEPIFDGQRRAAPTPSFVDAVRGSARSGASFARRCRR